MRTKWQTDNMNSITRDNLCVRIESEKDLKMAEDNLGVLIGKGIPMPYLLVPCDGKDGVELKAVAENEKNTTSYGDHTVLSVKALKAYVEN